jgi:hypothetical protein
VDRGAAGFLLISPELRANTSALWHRGFFSGAIPEEVADKIFKEKGVACWELNNDLLTYQRPFSFPSQSQVEYQVEARRFPEKAGYSVVGHCESEVAERISITAVFTRTHLSGAPMIMRAGVLQSWKLPGHFRS